mgnify:CR=1 FL=1
MRNVLTLQLQNCCCQILIRICVWGETCVANPPEKSV